MLYNESIEPRNTIDTISVDEARQHRQDHPELRDATIEELLIADQPVNTELRTRLLITRQEHQRSSDIAAQKIAALTASSDKKEQWKNTAIATRNALTKAQQDLAATKHDLGFKQHVIDRRNEELTQKKAQIRKLKHDLAFKNHVINRRNQEITGYKKQINDLEEQYDYERAKARLIEEQFRELMRQRELNDEVASLRAKLRAERNKAARLTKQNQSLEEQVKQQKDLVKTITERNHSLEEMNEEFEKENDTLTGLLEIWMPKTEDK